MKRQQPSALAVCVCVLSVVVSAGASQTADPTVNVKKEIYVANTVPKKAPWVYVFPGRDGYREEIHTVWSHESQVRGYGDSPREPRRRISHDNGKTWSPLTALPPMMTRLDKVTVLDWKFCGIYDPSSDRLVSLSIHHVRDMRQGPPRMIYNHALVRTSADEGHTYGPAQVLKYEAGDDLDQENVLNPKFLENNTAYPGQSTLRHSNGSLLIPVTNTRIPSDVEDEPSPRARWPSKGTIGSLCFVGRWSEKREQYVWNSGKPVWLPRTIAFNGLLEADVAELADGRVLIVWRITKSRDGKAHKWFSVSSDGGMTFSEPQIFGYSDGTRFFSASNFHRLVRSQKTEELYWIANITPHNPTNPGHPRYPLVIVEVDEDAVALKKETVTEIDTRQLGEGERMQLSNFWLIENRESLELEIYLTRLHENPEEMFTANAYKYTLSFEK
ncbi:MAG: sialidase family protein [Planctomycetota bacterium]